MVSVLLKETQINKVSLPRAFIKNNFGLSLWGIMDTFSLAGSRLPIAHCSYAMYDGAEGRCIGEWNSEWVEF